jgi:hypothetical protein
VRLLQVSLVALFIVDTAVFVALYNFHLVVAVTAAALCALVDEKLPAAPTWRLLTGGAAA